MVRIKQTGYGMLLLLGLFLLQSLGFGMEKEFRGVWVRPPANQDDIIKLLDDVQKAHFNVIFLETFYNGFTIYPGKVFAQRPELKGKDYLKFFITEAHKRNLEVHCWYHTFFWRYGDFGSAFLKENPDWLDKSYNGKGTRDFEKGYDFVNPAIPEVREKLQKLTLEILKNYQVDGIHLDYLRYAANGDKFGFGYNEYAVKKFQRKYDINPRILDPVSTPDAWVLWTKFREDQVTEVTELISKTIKKQSPKVKFSAAVFPDYYDKRYANSKMQNYGDWCEKGYVDFLTPMCYSYATTGILHEIAVAKQHAGKTPIYPGLAAMKGTAHPDFPTQIALVRKVNPAGHSLFAYSWLISYPGIFDILTTDVYKEPALSW